MPFKKICFEVSGVCNGRCTYCVTGAKNAKPGGFMEADAFDATLRDLERLHLIDSGTLVDLFNWGELFLHPDLRNIIRVVNDHNLRYSISTNGSTIPQIDEAFAKNLMSIFFAMCGFSQQSYDRIHKFEFDRITENIRIIASELRSSGYKKRIQILFHIYRFNTEELQECQRFANEMGISLAFYDAYVNDWWQLEALVHKTLPDEKCRKMLDDLFMSETQWSNVPDGWPCPQWDLMVIDERGNVPVCCNVPNNHPSYSLGAVDNGIAKRLEKRPNLPICKTCMASGMSYYTHHIRFKGDPSMLKLARRQIASRMRKDPRALFGLPEVIDLFRQGTEWIYLVRKR